MKEPNDIDVLMKYLQQEQSSQEKKQKAQDIINRGQLFDLHYERDEPLANDSESNAREALKNILSQKGVFVTSTNSNRNGKRYPGISAIFSRISISNKTDPNNWLEQMMLPINEDYQLKSVRIVYIPTQAIKKLTFEISKKVMSKIISDINDLIPEFKQLAEFNKAKISSGNWSDNNQPSYPNLNYRYGYGTKFIQGTKDFEKTTENWCSIIIGFMTVSDNPMQQGAKKRFSRQGIEVYWNVQSGNKEFLIKIYDIIERNFSPLNEYEKQLERQ
jgi:hypothetical protein